jgi:hypothetical protein
MICKVPKKCSLQNSHKWSVPVQSVIVGAVRPTRVKGSESRGFSIMNMKANFVNSFLRLVIQVWQEKLWVELLFREAEVLSVDGALALARAGFASEVATPVLLAKGASVTITRPQIWAHFDSELGSMGVRVSLAEATS